MPDQPRRSKHPRNPISVEIVTDPAELAADEARWREFKKAALGQMGPVLVVEAPLPLLAQYIVELPADERREFLQELVNRTIEGPIRDALAEALERRLGELLATT